jgi:hypothetical protein
MFTISRHLDPLADAADLLSARDLHADAYRLASGSRVALRRALHRVRCDRKGQTG